MALARSGAGAINNENSRGATNGKTRKQTGNGEHGKHGNVGRQRKCSRETENGGSKLLAAVSKVKVGGLGPAEIDLCAICFGFAH